MTTNSPKPQRKATSSTIETLPEEIILRVLSKLPFSYLIRTKCVCKTWKALAQQEQSRLSDLYSNNKCLMLYSHHSPAKEQLCFVDLSDSNCTEEETYVNEIQIPFGSSSLKLDMLGSCNGLLCLSGTDHNDQYIYNPFTSEYTELPKTNHSLVQWAILGFGFHPNTNEYKVVKFIYYRPCESLRDIICGFFMGRSEVQVFTLGSASWRSLGRAEHLLKDSMGNNVLVNGRLHYLSSPNKYRHDSDIISFDLEDEQFRMVKKPVSMEIRWLDYLLVLKGCVSVGSYASDHNELEIWVQKEYGVESSWVKWLNIAISHVPKALSEGDDSNNESSSNFRRWTENRVLCELKNEEILLEYDSRALVVYDPKKGSFKAVGFQGMPRLFQSVIHFGNLNQIDAIIV